MNILMATAAGKASTNGFVLLGHDFDGWTVALIAAAIAAVVYEAVMALTKLVTLRIPFLVLQIARAITPKDVRHTLYKKWKADLWDILRGEDWWVVRSCRGAWFALQLVVYGARSTAAVVNPDMGGPVPRGLARLLSYSVTGVVSGGSAGVMFDMNGVAALLLIAGTTTAGVLFGAITMAVTVVSPNNEPVVVKTGDSQDGK